MATEPEPSEYPAYRARLARVVYWVWTVYRLWGQWVRLDMWTEYSGDELRRKFRSWSLTLEYHRRWTRYEIEGVREDGSTVSLSEWKIKELQRQGHVSNVDAGGAKEGEFWEVAGLPETVVAYHLRECRRLSPDSTVREMHRRGYPHVSRVNVARKRGYGADAVKRKGLCAACEALKSGRMRIEADSIA
jgi:hypothetical protein